MTATQQTIFDSLNPLYWKITITEFQFDFIITCFPFSDNLCHHWVAVYCYDGKLKYVL